MGRSRVGLPKDNGGMQKLPRARWGLTLECKDRILYDLQLINTLYMDINFNLLYDMNET